ncbi:hypothetical protein UVI_02033740 [Ustilaginoidea virens]|uniref:Pentatricopeptide repeat domain-containing protein n=1 Tax=Ustilaginoidea virens TaxID=1159556 RepID=A0A1B5KTL9_USTVR|nr:hypothetical protein UVI_02033740 [Ustilaginoidea virens]
MFRRDSGAISQAVAKKQNSPYVPSIRTYPSPAATESSRLRSAKIARVQVGLDMVWKKHRQQVPDWTETFNLLKRITPKGSERPRMAAVRVVLPPSWDVALRSKRIQFLDATTGLAAKLRVSADRHSPCALVVRGDSAVLAKAADELTRLGPEVEIFELGEVAALDYKTKRLWPSVQEGGPSGGPPAMGEDGSSGGGGGVDDDDGSSRVWIHEETNHYWVDRPYEQTPRPKTWSRDSFEAYVTALACGQLRPHLAMKHYKQPRRDGKLVDTDGIRIRLILRAFADPAARECVTPPALKRAISFLAQKGGHRAAGEYLFTRAEEWGLPMDTEMFNMVLDGYVSKRDAAFFHRTLQKMEHRYFAADAATWLRFLRLVQRDDERRQIIAAMYELGLLGAAATRRAIARVMASSDAYAAFKAGKSPERFMADQVLRYGADWLAGEAATASSVMTELLRFNHEPGSQLGPLQLILDGQRGGGDGDGKLQDMRVVHAVLDACLENRDFSTAVWVLSYMHQHSPCQPDAETYRRLTSLAIAAGCPSSLGVLFFYGALGRHLRGPVRKPLRDVLLARLMGRSPVHIFSSHMARLLRASKVAHETAAVAGAEWAILRTCHGYVPVRGLAAALETTWRTMDRPRLWHARRFAGRDGAHLAMPALAVKLRHAEGRLPSKLVHLDAAFEPGDMIRRREPDGREPDGRGAQATGAPDQT